MQVCSADTLLRGMKELAVPTTRLENPESKVQHQFNINPRLNRLLIKCLVLTGQLNRAHYYVLDYDNQILPTEKYDATKTYKKTAG